LAGFAALVAITGCDPTPRSFPCATYVAGGFNKENQFALNIEGKDWPAIADDASTVELTFFLASGKPQKIDLVHVLNDHELERWTLDVSTEYGRLPSCTLTGNPGTSTCGALLRVLPQEPRGYWYLRGNDDLLEAGMSFVLCRKPGARPQPK